MSSELNIEQSKLHNETERWLLKQGLPHLIDDYTARTDVFTRMLPLMLFLFLGETLLAFEEIDHGVHHLREPWIFFIDFITALFGIFSTWREATIFISSMVIFLVGAAIVNHFRGRRLLQIPDSIGIPELTLVVLLPALLSMLVVREQVVYVFIVIVGFNLIVLGGGYVLTSYGLISMFGWSIKFMMRQLGQILNLAARSLPLLLLFSAFLFLNNEMWQVAANFTVSYYVIIMGMLVLVSCVFLGASVGEEAQNLGNFSSWDDVTSQVRQTNSPISTLSHSAVGLEGDFKPVPLTSGAKINVVLLLFISQFVRFLLAAVLMAVFFVVLGLLAVRRPTIETWTNADADALAIWHLFGNEVIMTWELLAVVGFISVLSGLQFVVFSLTDTAYKERFFDDITEELNHVLAVRRLYLVLRDQLSASQRGGASVV